MGTKPSRRLRLAPAPASESVEAELKRRERDSEEDSFRPRLTEVDGRTQEVAVGHCDPPEPPRRAEGAEGARTEQLGEGRRRPPTKEVSGYYVFVLVFSREDLFALLDKSPAGEPQNTDEHICQFVTVITIINIIIINQIR